MPVNQQQAWQQHRLTKPGDGRRLSFAMLSPSCRRNWAPASSRTKNCMSIAARPVALAIEILEAIEKRLFENPPTPDQLDLEMKAREARARVLALHEAPVRTDAVGKQGLLLQLLELDAAVDDTIVLDDVASKMKKLIALIRQSVEAIAPALSM
jgi:hypothetical protein